MHDPITEESLLLYMRRGNYHLIFVKSYFYNLCTIPRHFRCYSQNIPMSKRPIVKTYVPKKWSKRPHVKTSLKLFFLYLHMSTHMMYGLSINPERVFFFKKKERVWPDVFQTFFPVQSSFCGGTKSHMVPASIAQGNHQEFTYI